MKAKDDSFELQVHPNGRPYGMTKADWRMLKTGGPTIAERVERNRFDDNVKEFGLTEAMRIAGIE